MSTVLIVGYPKSGTTFISRLVANLLNAPLKGYWNSEHKEIATTGLDRQSAFECYKGHQSYEELEGNMPDHLIYVVRDPRAVCTSAANYFEKPLIPASDPLSKIGNKLYSISKGKKQSYVRAMHAILEGDAAVDQHLRLPWRAHLHPYLTQRVYTISYEDAVNEPHAVCVHLLHHLNIERSEAQIDKAIEQSSFDSMQAEFRAARNKEGLFLMRKGSTDSWRTELPPKIAEKLSSELQDDLSLLNYPLN